MTQVILKRKNNKIIAFEVSGHTGYAEEGADIVCASVSSVVWTVVNALQNILGLGISYIEDDGYIKCTLPELSENEREKADILLEGMAQFFSELQKQYGDYISKTEVE